MKFCSNCGNKLTDDAKFCDSCGAAIQVGEEPLTEEFSQGISTEEVSVDDNKVDSTAVEVEIVEAEPPVKAKKKFVFSKKILIIIGAALVVLAVAGVIIGKAVALDKYEENLEYTYDRITYGAQQAEKYSTLQSKVWRNCIYEQASVETDKYTKDKYGRYHSDFNDALSSFYEGESFTYSMVSVNVSTVNSSMSELKDCPKKFEDEYKALKELYVAYSDLTDLVVGDTSHSCTSFTEALNSAVSNYKNALSSARLLLD